MTSVSSLTLTTDVKNPVGKLQGGFECKYCSFQTQDLNEFTSHVDSAHPHVILNPTYICKLCNFSTKRYEMFMQHNQKNHPDNTKLALKVIKQNGTTFLEQNPVGGTEESTTANGEKNTAEVETEADQDKDETQGEAVGAFRAPMMQKLLDQKSSASKGDAVSNDQFSASSTLQKLCQTAANPPVTYATISVSNTDSHKNAVLRQYFDKFPYFTDKELDEIIDKTGMTNNEVRTWFNAQRQKLSVSWTAEEIEQYRVSGVPATWAQQKKEPEKTMKVVKTLFPSTRVSPAAKERTKTPAKASRPKPSPAGEGRNWKKTPEQLQLLKRAFGKTQFPTPLEVDKLVRASGLTAGVVKKWFSDTRYHVKHSKGTKGLCVYREDLNETLDSIIESSSVKSPHKNPRGRPPNSPKARGRPPLSQSARGRPRSPRSPRAQLNFNTPDSSTPKVKIERSSMDMEWLERKGKSEYQLDLLKIHFQQNPYPSEFDIDKLREETKMTAREIGRWFNDCRREKGLPQDEKYYVPPQEAVTQGTEEEADDAITPKDEPLSPGQPDLVDYFNGDVVEEDSGSDNDKSRSNDVNENSVQRDNGNKGRVASSRKVADFEEQNKKKSGDVKTTMKVFYDRTGRVKRRFKTEYQLRLLKESFQRCPHPDDLEIERLMRLTRLSKQDIRNYFSDKRYDVFKRNPHKMHQLSHQPHEPPSTLEDYLDEDDSLPTMVPPGTNMVLSPADILTRKRKRDDVEDFEEDGKIDGKKTAFQLDVVKASFSLNQRPGDTEVARINKLTKLSRKEILCWFGDTRYAFKHGKVKWIEKYRKMTEDPHYKKYLGMDQDDTSAPTSGETSPVTATSTPCSVPISPVRHSAHASSVDSTPTQSHQTESPTQQESPEQQRSPVSGKESIIGLQSIVSSMNPQKPLTNVEKLKMLTEQYERCPFILYHDAEELAAKTDLRVEQVLSWFERKREEEKKDTNEEDGHESEEEAASSMVHRSPNMAQRPLLDPDMQIQIIKPPMSQQQRPPAVTHIMNQQRPIAPRPILHPSLRPVVSPPMPRQHAPQQLRMQVPGNVQGQNFVMVSQVPQQHHMVQPGMLGPGGRPQIIYTIVPNQPAPSTPSQPQAIRVQSAMSLATGQQVMMQSSPPLQHQGVPSQPQPTMVVSSPPPPNVHQQQQHNNDRPNDLVRSILASCKIDISNWETVVYQCPRCKAVFPRWAPLENHEKVCNTPREDGTKPKPCIYLTMALVESYFMKEDVMTEDSSPLFKCSLCNQPYIEEKSLPLHLEEHTKQDVCMKYMYQLE
ncbi:transcription corepressor [Branchiostoma belcheri]|nr:transcription corepressor [Branchiostoma belcheri]